MGRFDYLYASDLSHRARSVYLYLADRANKQNQCWPSIATIAKELGLSQSTVRRALHELRQADYIQSEQRFRPNGGKSSLLYTLTGK
ncbi:MAG: helix-turn-helix domain-containing protein [Oscillospiraceae bacterium]|nr:helix-turn-helix domain-containing protein [Oscillospiraceae bacterium]